MCKSNILKKNNCSSITTTGDTAMCYCEGMEYFISNVFRVSHFADGPLGLVSDASAFRSMYFARSGGKLVLRKTRL